MSTPLNAAYQSKSPLVFRPSRTSPPPGRPVPLSDIEDLTAGTVVGAAVAGPPAQLTVGASLQITGTTLDIADASKGPIAISSNGTVFDINPGSVTEAMQVLADNTTNDVSTSKHGYVPKAPNVSTQFLNGAGAWTVPASSVALAAGTYTPTRSAEANLDSSVTMTQAQYMRVGNTVTVSGRFTADPTTPATATSFEITLPVASNIGAAEDVAGVAFCGAIAGMGAAIIGVAANDTAKIFWVASDVTSQTWSFTFTYKLV